MTDDKLETALAAYASVCAQEIGGGVVLIAFPRGSSTGTLQVAGAALEHMEAAAVLLLDVVRQETKDAGCACVDCKAALARVQPALSALPPHSALTPERVH